eukprot:3254666-Alexandrium_andersonii.AAC.1
MPSQNNNCHLVLKKERLNPCVAQAPTRGNAAWAEARNCPYVRGHVDGGKGWRGTSLKPFEELEDEALENDGFPA